MAPLAKHRVQTGLVLLHFTFDTKQLSQDSRNLMTVGTTVGSSIAFIAKLKRRFRLTATVETLWIATTSLMHADCCVRRNVEKVEQKDVVMNCRDITCYFYVGLAREKKAGARVQVI